MLETHLRALSDLVLPRTCTACGSDLCLHERQLCTECAAGLPLTCFWQERGNPMAMRFNELLSRDLEGYTPFSYAAALIYYGGASPYRNIPQAVKYRSNLRAGRHFARLLGMHLAGSPLFADVDLVVPVPLHPLRRLRRGYNQAEVLAREIARALPSARMDTGILRRRRHTRTQTRLSGEDKRRNVSRAFSAGRRPADNCRHILLIDDVFTTGSTLAACHKALRAVTGPHTRISVATLAFVR